jgi:hypothetical protein
MTTKAKIHVLKSEKRGHSDPEEVPWLDSYHTFSFADYYNPQYENFGCLRVINEDRVKGGAGFPTHGHREYEIYSYVVSGELSHKDSMLNEETIPAGGVQFTSAGTGITHSEYNHSKTKDVHFIQIWVKPNVSNLKPKYKTVLFSREQKQNQLLLMVGPDGDDTTVIKINNDISTYSSILEKDKTVQHTIKAGRRGLLHVIMTEPHVGVKVQVQEQDVKNELDVGRGDSLFIQTFNEDLFVNVTGTSDSDVEFLFFDIGK